jgi:type IV fimbrial biogenesis protein FimT
MQSRNNRPFRRHQRGFTMTELGITVTIAAILAAIAVPSFQGIIATQRARTYASALYATLSKARSEAITLNANVTLQPKAGGWNTGWQMFDINNNVLDDYTAAGNINTPSPPGTVTYTPSGRLTGAAPMFRINTVAGSQTNYQCVSVTPSGRPYMMATPTC